MKSIHAGIVAFLFGVSLQSVVAQTPQPEQPFSSTTAENVTDEVVGLSVADDDVPRPPSVEVMADAEPHLTFGSLTSVDERFYQVNERLRRLEESTASVLDQNRQLRDQNESLTRSLADAAQIAVGSSDSQFLIPTYSPDSHFSLVRPRDPQQTPFALNAQVITQLRNTGFARSKEAWTDSAGNVRPIDNFDRTDVVRNWLDFSGYAFDPRLQFNATLFNSSTNNSAVFMGGVGYKFSEGFMLSAGYSKLPGSREWNDSYRYTLGADRTMATTFFRPNFSPGIWASGQPVKDLYYRAMIGNSFNGGNLLENRIGGSMAFSGTVWWEPRGAFGSGPSDIESHDDWTPRIGSSLTISREDLISATVIATNPEATIFRLSDGTPLSLAGSVAPGVNITATDVQLWSIDAAVKYRGFSFSGEYYLRWLNGFDTVGGSLPINQLFDQGAYAQASYFIVPKQLEGFTRYSFVTGRFGGGDEWGGGVNWYVRRTRSWRITADVTYINHSPADNLLTGYRAGESGTLFELQMLTDF